MIADRSITRSILPTLYIGKRITEGRFPERIRFRKFKRPTHIPRQAGMIKLLKKARFLSIASFFTFFSSLVTR
jgi:hypothetical protein